jgi:hypothetical protein
MDAEVGHDPEGCGFTTLVARVPRRTRREIRVGRRPQGAITAIAADNSANTSARRRLVTLVE